MKKNYKHLKAIAGLVVIILMSMLSQNLNAQNILGHPRDVNIYEDHAKSVFFTVDVDPAAKLEFLWFQKRPGGLWEPMKAEVSAVLELPF